MVVAVGTILALANTQSASIDDVWQAGLKDASFRMTVGKSDQRELQKINKDFATSYRFDFSDVMLKEPFKLRMEMSSDEQKIVYIVNGGHKVYKIPRAGVSAKSDVSKAPGKRQTPFDFGVLTPSLFSNFMSASFVREDRRTGELVFDITYVSALKDTSRYRIWVDKSDKVMTKREWYNQKGFLTATFTYSAPQKVGGVMVPTKTQVNNSEGKFAGSMTLSNLKVNTGLDESLFAVK